MQVIKDTSCHSCHFVIREGTFAFCAGLLWFCQRCVKGPFPYGHEPGRVPEQRSSLENAL